MTRSILHPFALDPKYAPVQEQTDAFLGNLGPDYDIIDIPCPPNEAGSNCAYERGLKEHWDDPGDLFILEHDLVPTVAHLERMSAVDADIVVADYLLDRPNTRPWSWHGRGMKFVMLEPIRMHSAHRRYTKDWRQYEWTDAGDLADLYSLGLIRFSERFRQQHKPGWAPGHWLTLDGRVSEWTSNLGYLARIVRPLVKHNHLTPFDPSKPWRVQVGLDELVVPYVAFEDLPTDEQHALKESARFV